MGQFSFLNFFINNINHFMVFLLPALICFSTSPTVDENIYVSRTSLKIYLNTESPAYAALEDLRNEWTSNYLDRPAGKFKDSRLRWGENKDLWVLELGELRKYTKYSKGFRPLVVQSNPVPAIDIEIKPPPEALATQVRVEQPRLDLASVHPQRLKRANDLLKEQWSAPQSTSPLDQKLQAIVAEEKDKVFDPEKGFVLQNGITVAASSPSTNMAPSPRNYTPDHSREKYSRSYKISGNLTMKGGVAYTGFSDEIKIYRVSENLILDEGYVNIQEGFFEIEVKELFGYIVAELRGKNDQLKGYAEIDLHQLNLTHIKPSDTQLVQSIEILPFKEGFNLRAVSGLSFINNDIALDLVEKNGEQIINEGQVSISIQGLKEKLSMDKENKITSDMFTKDSNMLVRLEAKNHWGTLAIGLGHTDKKVRVYKDSLVKALIGQYSESHDGYAVIWGRVLGKNGQPLKGVQVELAGDSDIAVGPIYFNKAYLPDFTLQQTQADGLFAFIKVLPGLHALRAKVNGKFLPVELTVADVENVSYLEINDSGSRTMSLASYNPLTNVQVDTSVKLHGIEKIYDINSGERNLEDWPGRKGLAMLESDPGPIYELTRHLVDRKKHHLSLPVVSKPWLKRIFRQARANKDHYKGVVVGFVKGDNFEVYVGQELQGWDRKDIIYFDSSGRILPKKLGQAGGGFIMYNVPPGATSISILPTKAEKISTQLSIVDNNFVSVMNADFSSF